jgi:type VI secretion system secreted protein VgrG
MATYTQANQPLALTTPLGADALLLARLEGTEALSNPFQFRLSLLAQAPVSFDALLGQPATVRLTVPGSPQRFVNGILAGLEEGHTVQGAQGGVTFFEYEAELVPALWLLGHRAQSRVFQGLAVPDILKQVLQGDWGLDVRWLLTGTYPARDYCVQYCETDLAFVSRLMEEEGICYYFQHTDTKHTLVLADSGDGHPDLPGQSTLIFDAAAGGQRPEGRVTRWHKRQRVRPCKVTLRDHSFQLPASTLEASVPVLDKVKVGQVSHALNHSPARGGKELLEIYDYPGRYAWRFDGVSREGSDQPAAVQGLFQENGRVAHLRMEAEASQAVALDGASLCGHLLPGYTFALARHRDGDGSYLLTGVEHRADLTAAYLADAGPAGVLYENRFHASPAALPFRPPRVTPKPAIPGVQTATIVGPPGNDIFVDKYGRVKVKFHWDRDAATGPQNSCWLRVGQVWAGKRWGAYFWPRVGHEVVVSFVEGDPDRPLVVGSVYNEANMPPFALPDNRALAGVKSFTSTGNPEAQADPLANFSGIVFNDAKGKEVIELHGEKHIAFFGEHSHRHTIDGWHRLNVNGTHSVHVGAIPMGSGSGGGADDSNATAFVYSGQTQTGRIGAQISSVCGVNQSINLGLYSELTVGDYVNIVSNPLGMIADLGAGIPPATSMATGVLQGVAAVLGGNYNLILGSNVSLNYGTAITINRGAHAAISESTNWRDSSASPATAALSAVAEGVALVIASLSTAGAVGLAVETYDKDQLAFGIVEGVAGGLAAVLVTAESFIATANQVANAKAAATAGILTQADKALVDTAAYLVSLVQPSQQGLNKGHFVQGTTAEYNGASRIIGGNDSVLIFGGKDPDNQTAIALSPRQIKMAAGVPLAGGQLWVDAQGVELASALDSTLAVNPAKITLTVNPTTSITLEPGKITLASDPTTSLTIETGKITLTAGTNCITLSAAAGITQQTPTSMLTVGSDGQVAMTATFNIGLQSDEQVNILGTSGNCTIPNFMLQ